MAHHNWEGKSIAVAQVEFFTITGYDAATTYKITIGGVVVSVLGTTDIATTTDALAAALTASTHPYFTAVTFVSDGTSKITATAKVSGYPYEWTPAVAGGTGTISSVTVTTASSGPHHWNDVNNLDDATTPVATDTIDLANGSVGIFFGLDDLTAVLLASFKQKISYTGNVGLPTNSFAVNDGVSDATVQEYRNTYLEVKATRVTIGERDLGSLTLGSGRVKIKQTATTASVTHVYETAQITTEPGLPAVRLTFANVNCDLKVYGGRAGIGVGIDPPNEAVTMGDVYVGPSATDVNVSLGDSVTYDNWEQHNGEHSLGGGIINTQCTVHGGKMTSSEDLTIPTFKGNGGTSIVNGIITTGTLNPGTKVDASQNNAARTWATVTIEKGASLTASKFGAGGLTIGTLNLPGERAQLAVS